jgi:putative transposase
VSDEQWKILQRLLPEASGRGRPRLDRRWILNAILYILWTGCQWRALPSDFPKWRSVYTVFRRWRLDGTWERIHAVLRGRTRKAAGKKPTPTALIVDSQTAKTTLDADERGYDCAKKLLGRKRHLAVDTLGLVWSVVVHAASMQDQDGARLVLQQLQSLCRRLKVIFADSAYGRSGLPAWTRQTFGWLLQTVLRPVSVKGFVILPKRWIVERTFSWISASRRFSKDYERLPDTTRTMIYIRMIHLMSRRLAKQNAF